jgi:hypothetical protein
MMQNSLYEPRTWDVPLPWYWIAIKRHSSHKFHGWICSTIKAVKFSLCSPWRRVTV